MLEILLSNDQSHFASLVEQEGAGEAKHLHRLAKQKKWNNRSF